MFSEPTLRLVSLFSATAAFGCAFGLHIPAGALGCALRLHIAAGP